MRRRKKKTTPNAAASNKNTWVSVRFDMVTLPSLEPEIIEKSFAMFSNRIAGHALLSGLNNFIFPFISHFSLYCQRALLIFCLLISLFFEPPLPA